MGVSFAAKVGVSILALLVAALPAMACTVPGATMTAAEHDCCKRMAEQCGHSGMAKSHGCCQPQVSPSDFHPLIVATLYLFHRAVADPAIQHDIFSFWSGDPLSHFVIRQWLRAGILESNECVAARPRRRGNTSPPSARHIGGAD